MRKKLFCLFLLCCYVVQVSAQEFCAFCDESIVNRQKIYESLLIEVLYTHKPITEGHCLIIPKRHIEQFDKLSEEEMIEIYQAIKKVNLAVSKTFHTSAYLLAQKNGKEVGQTVPHVHFHYIPKKKGNTSSLKFVGEAILANLKSPIAQAEMQSTVEKLKKAMEETD